MILPWDSDRKPPSAIMRLGFSAKQKLILTCSIKAAMSRIELAEEWIRAVLWRHSFTTAMVSLHVNRVLNIGFQGKSLPPAWFTDFGRTSSP